MSPRPAARLVAPAGPEPAAAGRAPARRGTSRRRRGARQPGDSHPKTIPFSGGAAIFQRMFTRLGCRGRAPHFEVSFYPYASLSHTIRLRDERAEARISDILRGASLEVLEATAALLLAKMYRLRLASTLADTYRRFSESAGVHRRMERLRRRRGRRTHSGPQGRAHDLRQIFSRLNTEYFAGRLPATDIGWSRQTWRRQLGVFDPGLRHIVINRRLDRSGVPPHAVAYVVHHEMLHLERALPLPRRAAALGSVGAFPPESASLPDGRRRVSKILSGREVSPAFSPVRGSAAQLSRCHLGLHTPEFRRAEKLFHEYAQARRYFLRAGLW